MLNIRIKDQDTLSTLDKIESKYFDSHFFSANKFDCVDIENSAEMCGDITFTNSTTLYVHFAKVLSELKAQLCYQNAMDEYYEISPIILGHNFDT